MTKITEVFAGDKDILAVFHEKKTEEVKSTGTDNYFYILYRKHPACGDIQECTSKIHSIIGGRAFAKSIKELDLSEKVNLFLNYHIIYNPEPSVTQEYVTRTLKTHAAYKKAATKQAAFYRGKYGEEGALDKYYSVLAIPLILSILVFIVMLVKKQDTTWLYFSRMWVIVFLTVYILAKVLKIFDKILPLLYSGDNLKSESVEFAEAKKLIKEGHTEKAIIEFGKFVAKFPDRFEPNYRLAQLLEQLGDYKQAILEYQNSFMKEYNEETLAGILLHLSEIYFEKMKDQESGKKYLNRILEEFPASKMAKKASAKLEQLSK